MRLLHGKGLSSITNPFNHKILSGLFSLCGARDQMEGSVVLGKSPPLHTSILFLSFKMTVLGLGT